MSNACETSKENVSTNLTSWELRLTSTTRTPTRDLPNNGQNFLTQ